MRIVHGPVASVRTQAITPADNSTIDLTEEAERLAHVGILHDHSELVEASRTRVVSAPGTRFFLGPVELSKEQGETLIANGLVEILIDLSLERSVGRS